MLLPPTTNESDDKDKRRLLKQMRKLSQIFGEVPPEISAQPHVARCTTPAVEAPSPDSPRRHVLFPSYTFIDSPSRSFRFPLSSHSAAPSSMAPQLLSPTRDALGRSSSTRRLPARPTTHFDESARRPGHSTIVTEMPARSSSLRILNHVHQLPKDKSRRRSVHNPIPAAFHAHPRRSIDNHTSTHSQRRSVSLWSRRITKDDPAHQRHSIAVQGQEDGVSGDTHPPLTEAQRTQSLRRGRKLAQVCTFFRTYFQSLNVILFLPCSSLEQSLQSPCTGRHLPLN